MTEETMLMRLVESAEPVEPDWDDALRRAGFVGRRLPFASRRRLLVLAAAALAAVLAVSALAAGRQHRVVYWLFDRSPETYPLVQVPTVGEWSYEQRAGLRLLPSAHGLTPEVLSVPVLHGEVAGHRWEVLAFMHAPDEGSREELYVGFHPGGTPPPYHGTDVPAFDSVDWGIPMRGLRPPGGEDLHWVGWGLLIPGMIEPSGGGTGPKYLYGPAAPNVRQVDLESDDGTVVRVPTFAGPPDLAVRVRLWVAVLRLDRLVHTIVPRDANGKALEHWKLDIAE